MGFGRRATVGVDIDVNAKGVGPGVRDAEGQLDRFGSKASKIGKVAAVGFGFGAIAAVGLAAKLIGVAEGGAVADRRLAQVTKSMGLFGKGTDAVTKRLGDYADKMARKIGVDDDDIKLTQAKLMTFKEVAKTADKAGGAFDRATAAAHDMAAAGFGDAAGNAVQLGKALNDPIKGITALTKSGITFTTAEKARIQTLVESNRMGEAQAIVLKAIETQVGGTAAATATMTDRLKTGFGQAVEALGTKLLPTFEKVGAWIMEKGAPAAARLAETFGKKVGPAVAAVGHFIGDVVVPAGQALYGWFVEKIAPGIVRYVTPIIEGLRSAFAKIAAKIEENHESLGKLGNVLKKVAEFIATKVYPVIGTLLGGAFKTLGTAIGVGIDAISALIDIISTAVEWVGKLADKLGKVGGAVGKVGGFIGKLNPFAAEVFTADPFLLTVGPRWGNTYDPIDAGGVATASLGSPDLAFGGARAAGAGLIVIDRREFPTNIYVNDAYDPVRVARELTTILNDQARRLGKATTIGV